MCLFFQRWRRGSLPIDAGVLAYICFLYPSSHRGSGAKKEEKDTIDLTDARQEQQTLSHKPQGPQVPAAIPATQRAQLFIPKYGQPTPAGLSANVARPGQATGTADGPLVSTEHRITTETWNASCEGHNVAFQYGKWSGSQYLYTRRSWSLSHLLLCHLSGRKLMTFTQRDPETKPQHYYIHADWLLVNPTLWQDRNGDIRMSKWITKRTG